jgi:hypothetical protein
MQASPGGGGRGTTESAKRTDRDSRRDSARASQQVEWGSPNRTDGPRLMNEAPPTIRRRSLATACSWG